VFLADKNKIVLYTLAIGENRFVPWKWSAVHSLKNTDTRDAVFHVRYAIVASKSKR
jgi:hypothetical protein